MLAVADLVAVSRRAHIDRCIFGIISYTENASGCSVVEGIDTYAVRRGADAFFARFDSLPEH